jgi:ribosome maturation factor RimP
MAQRHSRGDRRGSGAPAAPGRSGSGSGDSARTGRGDRGDSAGRADSARTETGREGRGRTGRADRAGRGGGASIGFRPPSGVAQRTKVREVIEPVIGAAGYDLEDLHLSRAGRRHLVRVTVDGDGGISLDAVAEVSRLVSAALDAAEAAGDEIFAGEYELQVSSPGVDRALTLPRHWRRNVGRLVQVRVGERQLAGRIVASDERGIVLESAGERHDVPFDALGPGKIQLEFTRLAALSDAELEDMLDPVDDDGDTGGDGSDRDDHGGDDLGEEDVQEEDEE